MSQLSDLGETVPVTECHGCGGTIWRDGDWFQCPDCGGMSTKYGGFFESRSGKASQEFVDKINQAKPAALEKIKTVWGAI